MISRVTTIYGALSRREKLAVASALAVCLVAGFLLSLFLLDRLTKTVPADGGILREGEVSQPVYLNPVITNASDADKDLIALVFSSITDVAKKISVSPNGRLWTVRLRDNVRWHDGEKLTADDIIFTIQKIQDSESRSPLFVTWQGVVPERVSELELTLTTGAPYAFFENNLKNLYIIPAHIYSTVPTANWRISNFNLEPVGSGPFKIVSYKKERNGFISAYNLVRNENYFGDKPYIGEIQLNFFTDEQTAVNAFNAGRVDTLSGLSPKNISLVVRNNQLINFFLPRYYAIFLNASSNDLLKNQSVRLALTYAVDKKKIVEQVFRGFAAEAVGPLPPSFHEGGAATDTAYFNPDEARRILDEANIKMGSDGFRGEIKLIVPKITFLTDTAELVKAYWEAIGIKTTLIVLDPGTIANDVIKTRNYDALLFGNILSQNPDMFSFWHSSERFYPGLNLSLYNNKTADKLIESIRKNFDEASRTNDIVSLSGLIAHDVPAVFLYSPNYVYITSSKVHGIDTTSISLPSERFRNIEAWYVKTKILLK